MTVISRCASASAVAPLVEGVLLAVLANSAEGYDIAIPVGTACEVLLVVGSVDTSLHGIVNGERERIEHVFELRLDIHRSNDIEGIDRFGAEVLAGVLIHPSDESCDRRSVRCGLRSRGESDLGRSRNFLTVDIALVRILNGHGSVLIHAGHIHIHCEGGLTEDGDRDWRRTERR